uniref:Uncharacterized protein n=1 Tax=Odontella aurita TaxID=265563 RepID=A0A7S4JFA5_9STRA
MRLEKRVAMTFYIAVLIVCSGVASGSGSIQLSAFTDSACPGKYQTFPLDECTLMYKCFQALNGKFGHIYPRFVDQKGEVVAVDIYGKRYRLLWS